MDEKFNSIISIAIIPRVIELISNNYKLDEIAAINRFYNSQTYKLLSDEKTKLWHYSFKTIYLMWETEYTSGKIIFPED